MAPLNLSADARFIDIAGGTAEHEWQACEQLQALPELELCHLVPPRSRAVILAPHPDDETLGCGGLIARLATMMRDITVIAISNGEASHPSSSALSSELPALRAAESADAMRCLGADHIEVLRAGIEDGRVERHREQLKNWLTMHLRPTDILFAPWRLDGHPDHEAVGNVAVELEHEMGCKLIEVPIWGWHWADPQGRSMPWGRARKLAFDPATEWKKRRALRCYRSQVGQDGERPAVLPAPVLAHFVRPYEVFFV